MMQKLVVLFILAVLCCSFAAEVATPLVITFASVMLILAAIYEALSRIIPTTTTWSIIGKILEVLTWLSNLLDRKK